MLALGLLLVAPVAEPPMGAAIRVALGPGLVAEAPGALAAQGAAPGAMPTSTSARAGGAATTRVAVAEPDPDEITVPPEARDWALGDLAILDACPASRGRSGAGAGALGGSRGTPGAGMGAGGGAGPAAGQAGPHAAGPELQRLRAHYLLAVDDRASLETAWRLHRGLEGSDWARTPDGRATLEGYRGALLSLEAKHGFWPHARIRDLRRGLDALDAQVARTPEHEEVRYLRLLSTAFLPGILGRRETAEGDLERLAELLPRTAHRYPQRTWILMADTVEALLLAHDPALARRAGPAFQSARGQARQAAIPLAAGCRVG